MTIKPILTKEISVTVQTIDGEVRTGTVMEFGEHVVIIACGVHRYVVRKKDLEKQGYQLPVYKHDRRFSIIR